MMRTLLSILFLISYTGFGQPSKSTIQLWHAGFMHPNEVIGKTGQVWFGLYETESGFELKKTKVTVIDSSDGLHDRYVSVNQPSLPIFLVCGIENIKTGPIKTVFFGNFHLDPDEHIVLDEKDGYFYGLAASGTKEGEVIHNYEVKFYNNRVKQAIYKRNPAYSEGALALIWAGDLDRDGKIDLLMDLANHYNASEPTLFLSSKAAPAELVKKVASYVSIGC